MKDTITWTLEKSYVKKYLENSTPVTIKVSNGYFVIEKHGAREYSRTWFATKASAEAAIASEKMAYERREHRTRRSKVADMVALAAMVGLILMGLAVFAVL